MRGCLLLVALVAPACGDDAAADDALAGIVREPAPVVGELRLPDAVTGEQVALRAAPGGLLVVYFGYLSCPDVCPTTMADLRTALGTLDRAARARVDVVMTTVDPGRDTGVALRAYVQAFVPEGRALRTEDDAVLRAVAAPFGADYRVGTSAAGAVEVSHTAFVYVVDDQGVLRLTWPFGTTAKDLASDLERLLARVDDAA